MSGFSAVDDSVDPARLVSLLDAAAAAESGMKQYAVAAHALRRPTRPILDVGCGAGHDLALFASARIEVVGVDASAVMVATARQRTASLQIPVVRAAGERLPFRDRAFSGCRIERVLMHVDDPALVLAEAIRCVEHGGLVTAFEPDWSSFSVCSDVLPECASWITSARHPDMGARLWELLEEHGCDVVDRVEELSVWRSLATLEQVADFPASVDRAVAAGRLERHDADEWIREQRQRDAAGRFYAVIPKIQVIATRREPPRSAVASSR
jgi:SAM-dependent methyltransferase